MGYARALVEIPRDTTLPADIAINTFHFLTPGDVASSGADISTALETFYLAVDAYLSANVGTSWSLKVYDLEDASPRVPVFEDTMGPFTPGVGQGLPEEVAVCLSYEAAAVSGQNQARRRGRIYLGPLDADLAVNTVAGRTTVASAAMTAIASAASGLAGGNPLTDPIWCVFSPTTAGPAPWSAGVLSTAFYAIASGYIDDQFDTQRRRESPPTARTTWTA